MDIQLAVIYGVFIVLGGAFSSYILKIWISRNDEITKIKQNGNNVKEFLELRDRFLALQTTHRSLKMRYQNLKDDGIDYEDLDIDEHDDDDTKLSKIARGFGIPKGIADALDNKELQDGIGEILKKNSKPVLALVDDYLDKKRNNNNDPTNIDHQFIGV